MFWPPLFRPNNMVTVNDGCYVFATADDPRFAEYVVQACFLSPWLARADQDTRWVTGDPMARVLLCGEVPDLFSFNADGHGAVLQIGDPVLGSQQWEVVSYFDWYDASDGARKGIMAWCRLTVATPEGGGEGEGGGGEDEGLGVLRFDLATTIESEPQTNWGPTPGAVPDACHYGIAIVYSNTSASVTSVSVDGTALTFIDDVQDMMAGNKVSFWSGNVSPGAGLLDINFSAGVTFINVHTLQMYGVTGPASGEEEEGTGGGSNPFISSAPTPVANADSIIMVVFASQSTSPGDLTFDYPFDTNQAAELVGGRKSRSSYYILTSVAYWTAEMSITPSNWIAIGVVFA